MTAGATSRRVVLPPGTWFNWWNDSLYQGQNTITIGAPLTSMPLLIKGDAFLPTTPAVKSTDYYNGDTLQVNYYPADTSKTANFTLYLDDGIHPGNLAQNNYRTMSFTGNHGQTGNIALSIDLTQQGGFTVEPALRSLTYIIHNFDLPANDSVISINSSQSSNLPASPSLTALQQSDSTYFYDSNNRILYAKYTIAYSNNIFEIKGAAPPDTVTTDFTLLPPYPNPFTDYVVIGLDVFEAGQYTLTMHNIVGQKVYTQIADFSPGHQTFNCSAYLASGVYMVSVKGKKEVQNQRVVLIH